MPDPRTSPTDPAPTDPAPPGRPRRVSRTLLTAMIAGGLVVGGTGIAFAAATAPSPSADAPPASPGPGAGPGKDGHRGPHGGPRGDRADDIDGRITAVDPSSVTVSDEFGQARTFTLGPTTRVRSGPGRQLTAADLTVGEHVHVHGQPATGGGNAAAVEVDVRQARIDGVVTAVDGTSVTVTDRDGFIRHITTSSSTTYRTAGPKGGGPQGTGQNGTGQASTADSVHAGSVIRAEGTVDGDGTTLDATTVVVRTAPGPTPSVSPGTQPAPGPAGQSPAPQPGQPSG